MSLSGWSNSKKLKLLIDSSKIDEDLIDFPVNITLSSGTGQTGFDTTTVFDELATVSGTKKIAITTTVSGIETELYIEIEQWDWAAEKANLWVKVPTVFSGTNTELYLYYDSDHADNTTYIGDTGDTSAQSVWSNNFKAVYHMAQDPNGDVAGAIKDSTANANHGTPVGAMTSADLVDGKVGKAIDFDGTNDCIVIGDSVSLDFDAEDMSVFICFKLDEITDVNFLLCKGEDFGQKDYRILKEAADLCAGYEVGNGGEINVIESALLDDTDWHSTTLTYVESTKTLSLYYDDALKDTTVGGYSIASSSYDLILASRPSEYFLDGKLAEVRISSGAPSVAWVKATHYSNWNDLISFSGETVTFTFTDPAPTHLSTAYGTTEQVCLTTTISGEEPEYIYDAAFYDEFAIQIGTTISGIQSGQPAESNEYLSTPSGIDYSWYMTATSSGGEGTSDTYTFHNKFLASGTTEINGTLVSGIDVRLYLRDTGELIGSSISTVSGTFNIETQYNAEFYCVALSPYTDTNSLIYDFLELGD